jgi:hypothetical protein
LHIRAKSSKFFKILLLLAQYLLILICLGFQIGRTVSLFANGRLFKPVVFHETILRLGNLFGSLDHVLDASLTQLLPLTDALIELGLFAAQHKVFLCFLVLLDLPIHLELLIDLLLILPSQFVDPGLAKFLLLVDFADE